MTNRQSTKRRIVKFFLIGYGTITFLVAAVVIWLGVQVFSNPDDVESDVPDRPSSSPQTPSARSSG